MDRQRFVREAHSAASRATEFICKNAGRTYDEAASGSQEIVCVQSIGLDTWSGAVSDVTVADNRVSGSGYAGFRA